MKNSRPACYGEPVALAPAITRTPIGRGKKETKILTMRIEAATRKEPERIASNAAELTANDASKGKEAAELGGRGFGGLAGNAQILNDSDSRILGGYHERETGAGL